MKEEKYIFRVVGPIFGFMLAYLPLNLFDEPKSLPEYESLENKIWYCDQAKDYLKKMESSYLVSSVEFKRDSLILEKKGLESTPKYRNWKESEKERKGRTGLIFGLGLLGGFGAGYYGDRKRIRKNVKEVI